MKNEIKLSSQELMNQASMTASEYFGRAIVAIDERFGEGYAEEHSELVSQFMRVAAIDFDTAIKTQVFQEFIYTLNERFREVIERFASLDHNCDDE